jgi:hypothetical protein
MLNTVELASQITGHVYLPGDEEYDRRRLVFNGMIDKKPAVIVTCYNSEDVVCAVNFAKQNNLQISVKSSGHNIAGKAVIDDGLVIDFTGMNSVIVDPDAKIASADPGAMWATFDRETQKYGLAAPGGTVSDTAVAGLTLGGGIGWLIGEMGYTCDNLLSAEVVTTDGEILSVDDENNSDLMWALRGGGGGFCIVTKLNFRLRPLTNFYAGSLAVKLEDCVSFIQDIRALAPTIPDHLSFAITFLTAADGQPVVSLDICSTQATHIAQEALKPFTRLPGIIKDTLRPRVYREWQSAIDDPTRTGLQMYWKSAFFADLSDDVIHTVKSAFEKVPSPRTKIFLEHIHGQALRTPSEFAAFGNRSYEYNLLILSEWEDAEQDDENIGWTRSLFSALQADLVTKAYINYLDEDDIPREHSIYDRNTIDKLLEIKEKYDKHNLLGDVFS